MKYLKNFPLMIIIYSIFAHFLNYTQFEIVGRLSNIDEIINTLDSKYFGDILAL